MKCRKGFFDHCSPCLIIFDHLHPQSLTWNLKSWWFPSSESPNFQRLIFRWTMLNFRGVKHVEFCRWIPLMMGRSPSMNSWACHVGETWGKSTPRKTTWKFDNSSGVFVWNIIGNMFNIYNINIISYWSHYIYVVKPIKSPLKKMLKSR